MTKHWPREWLAWLAVVLLCIMPFWAVFSIRTGLPHDDAFITFTYARSLASGVGFTYNVGPPYLGTTTPLLTLILAGLKWVFPYAEIYILARVLGAILWSASTALAFLLGRRWVNPATGVLMAGLLMSVGVFPHILPTEYPLLLCCGLGGLCLLTSHRDWAAGIAFGVAFLARGDTALLAGLATLAGTVDRRRVPWGVAAGFVLAVTPWFVYGTLTFGNPLPATLTIKQAHEAVGAWPPLRIGFQRWVAGAGPWFQSWLYGVAGTALGGLVFSLVRQRWLAATVGLWGIAHAIAYLWLDVPFYFWYGMPLYVSFALSAGVGLGLLIEAARKRRRADGRLAADALTAVGAAVILVSGLLVSGGYVVQQTAAGLRDIRPRQAAYVETGRWLAGNTPPDSTVGFIEIGIVGYFSQRQIVDFLGLVMPGTQPFLLQRDHAGILQAFHPDYYIRNSAYDDWDMNRMVHESIYFREEYVLVTEIEQAGSAPVFIYRRSK